MLTLSPSPLIPSSNHRRQSALCSFLQVCLSLLLPWFRASPSLDWISNTEQVNFSWPPVHTQWLSHVWLFTTPRMVALQVPLSMEFPRQEYWSGLPFPPPGDLPGPGIEATSLCIGRQIFYHLSTWEAPLKARLILSPHSPVIFLEHKL